MAGSWKTFKDWFILALDGKKLQFDNYFTKNNNNNWQYGQDSGDPNKSMVDYS